MVAGQITVGSVLRWRGNQSELPRNGTVECVDGGWLTVRWESGRVSREPAMLVRIGHLTAVAS